MDKKDNSIKTNNTVFINSIAIIQFIYLIFIGICMSSDSLSSSSIEQIIFLIASIILSIIGLVGIIKGII